MPRLRRLWLVGNPVCLHTNYKRATIAHAPELEVLFFFLNFSVYAFYDIMLLQLLDSKPVAEEIEFQIEKLPAAEEVKSARKDSDRKVKGKDTKSKKAEELARAKEKAEMVERQLEKQKAEKLRLEQSLSLSSAKELNRPVKFSLSLDALRGISDPLDELPAADAEKKDKKSKDKKPAKGKVPEDPLPRGTLLFF